MHWDFFFFFQWNHDVHFRVILIQTLPSFCLILKICNQRFYFIIFFFTEFCWVILASHIFYQHILLNMIALGVCVCVCVNLFGPVNLQLCGSFLTSKSGGNGNKTPHRKFIWFVDAQSNKMTEGYWQPEEGWRTLDALPPLF